MCGISGCLYTENINKRKANNFTRKSIKEIIYRGPDDNSFAERNNICLGSCRLSINDLREVANMPMISKCSRYILVFNGEIYNFKKLREDLRSDFEFKTNSDSEVVLNSFIKYREDCFDRFEGMFALAIWDDHKKELILARDRLGKKPLYYEIDKDKLFFCSEIKPLINNLKTKNINENFLEEIALFGEQSLTETAYKNILKIKPNTYSLITIKDSKISTLTKSYKKLNFKCPIKKNYKLSFREDLKESVKKRLISDRPVAIALSGGVDSAAICKTVADLNEIKPPVFTISFDNKDPDVLRSKIIAQRYKLNHHIINYRHDENEFFKIIEKIGEPFCDPAIAYLSALCENIPKDIKVLLTGDGGDEAFLGYKKYFSSYFYNLIPKSLRDFLIIYPFNKYRGNNRYFRYLTNKLHLLKVYSSSNMLELELNFISFIQHFVSVECVNKLNQIAINRNKRYQKSFSKYELYKNYCIHDISTRLPGRYLPKVDLAGSFNSIEIRSPYLDDSLLSKSISLMLNGNSSLIGKPLLKELLMEDFPKSFFAVKKRGFSPINFLLSDKLIQENLINIRSKNFSFVINELADAFIKNPGLKNHWAAKSILWNLTCISSWYSSVNTKIN